MNTFLILLTAFFVLIGADTYVFIFSGALDLRKRWRHLFSKFVNPDKEN